jgi:hypothetical protein
MSKKSVSKAQDQTANKRVKTIMRKNFMTKCSCTYYVEKVKNQQQIILIFTFALRATFVICRIIIKKVTN